MNSFNGQANPNYNTNTGCDRRLVVIPILQTFGSTTKCDPPDNTFQCLEVLGYATFGIAVWASSTTYGTPTQECGKANKNDTPAPFACELLWGYLIQDAQPPGFLLQQIGTDNNPIAPYLIALTE